MAQHSLTFQDILTKNVRHIYSGLPTEIRFRRPKHQHAIQLYQRIYEEQTRPSDRFQRRFQEYIPGFNIYLPRAPAFRRMSKSEVDDIVFRVCTPTNTSRSPCETCHRELTRQFQDMCIDCEMAIAKKKPVSRTEMREIVGRLSRQTRSSERRSLLRTMNPDPSFKVRPCTAQERLLCPRGRSDCCVPCQILYETHCKKRPRSSFY